MARISRDEASWVFARAAELDAVDRDVLDEDPVRTAAVQAGLSETAIQRALVELRAGAPERAASRARERRAVVVRGATGALLLATGATLGLLEGYNPGDLIPIGLLALPYLYVRDKLRELRS